MYFKHLKLIVKHYTDGLSLLFIIIQFFDYWLQDENE